MHSILDDTFNRYNRIFYKTGEEVFSPADSEFSLPGWYNFTWTSPDFFKEAHVNVIDARDTRGIWMMHCCVYPHNHNPGPIFGFDIFAGKSKVTGAFLDYSPVIPEHAFTLNKRATIAGVERRTIPDWGVPIFSKNILALKNIQHIVGISGISYIAITALYEYLRYIKPLNNLADDVSDKHRFYCQQQKLNKNNINVLMALGLSEDQATKYINSCLFPFN